MMNWATLVRNGRLIEFFKRLKFRFINTTNCYIVYITHILFYKKQQHCTTQQAQITLMQ